MRGLVEYIAGALVDDRSSIHLREIPRHGETRLELRVAPHEIGRLIGRQGRTARSLRSLLAVCGKKVGKRFTLEIVE